MNMAQQVLRSVDTVVTHQALITGRVTDGLTGGPTHYPFTIELRYQTAVGQPQRSYPLTPRTEPSGLFVFPGVPTTAFPRLSPGETLELRLAVSAPRYQGQEVDITLTDADLTLADQTLDAGGFTATASVLDAPLVEQTFALLPEPVHLGGRVVSADDPEQPIPNAEVRITAPEARGPITTDVNGFFTLQNLPVAQEVTVQVSAPPDFVQRVTTLRLDYRQPVNHVAITLEPA
jgi:hypothetical protein